MSWRNIFVPTDEKWFLDDANINDEDVQELVDQALETNVRAIYLNKNRIGNSIRSQKYVFRIWTLICLLVQEIEEWII